MGLDENKSLLGKKHLDCVLNCCFVLKVEASGAKKRLFLPFLLFNTNLHVGFGAG